MARIADYLSEDHGHCDDLFVAAENAVSTADWALAQSAFTHFKNATLCHLAREEVVLFPAFESTSGMVAGPTQVMRMEHTEMRDTLAAMEESLLQHDSKAFLGLSETLLMLMRQHNIKEEQILYRMCDQMLAGDADNLVERMAAVTPGAAPQA